MTERRSITFANPLDKARYLDGAARDDACCPPIVALGELMQAEEPAVRAVFIHRFVRDRIRYARDPGGQEQLADSLTVLQRGWDDCDGKSRLFCALAIAAGLEARIRPVFASPGAFTHVQAEVRWSGSEEWPGAEPDGWIVAELILAGVELGEGVEAATRDADGNVVLA